VLDAKLRQHRAALEAGADPKIISEWMAETQALHAAAETRMHSAPQRQSLSREEIMRRLTAMRDIVGTLATADPVDKATMYAQVGLSLIYHPDAMRVDVKARPMSGMRIKRCPRPEGPRCRSANLSR
jgi:site-specific DNA recombinase